MATHTLADAITRCYRLLHDEGNVATTQLLTDTEYERAITDATRRYSIDRPREVVVDVATDGTSTTALPAAWEDGFSRLLRIEHPVTGAVADGLGFRLYRSPTGLTVRWADGFAPATGTIRLAYTAPRSYGAVAADTTVRDSDHEAVCTLAAGIACDTLAARAAATVDPVVSADRADQASKTEEWLRLGRRLEQRYKQLIEDLPSELTGSAVSGSAWVEWDTAASDGRAPLFHGGRRYSGRVNW